METGRPQEITVIVYRGRSLQGKKKGRGKFHVVFSVGSNKFKSEIADDPSGNPEWNNEAEIAVSNPQDPLILKVKEKDDILGQIVVPLAELPTRRTDRQRCVALQPHKKCPNPQGELVYSAWISKKAAPSDIGEEPEKTSKKNKGNKKDNELTLQQQTLAMHQGGLGGSQLSLNSTGDVEKKKSMMKKLKGALSHSPMMGRRLSTSKSTSMMNLAPQPMSLAVADPELRKSQESINSQASGHSNESSTKKKSAMEKLKHKIGKSPMLGRKEISKSNSQSMSNLNVLDPQMKLSDVHSSNESLKSSKSNKSGKSFKGMFAKKSANSKLEKPITAAFDLSKPSPHLLKQVEPEQEYGAVPFSFDDSIPDSNSPVPADPSTPPRKPPRSNNNSPSQTHANTLKVDDDNPFQRRNNSVTSRKRPEMSQRSPAVLPKSPLAVQHNENRRSSMAPEMSPQPKSRNVFAINSNVGMESGLWASEMAKKSPESKRKTQTPEPSPKPVEKVQNEEDMNPFADDKKNDNNNPFDIDNSNPFEADDKNPFNDVGTTKPTEHEKPMSVQRSLAAPRTPLVEDTPNTIRRKLAAPFVFSASDDENDEKKPPEISGISPREGTTEGGTKITIRGEYLGKSKDDIVTLTVCGVNCLPSLQYYSEYKICCTTGQRKSGSGKIVIETKTGGLARSTLDYIFVQPKPPQEPVQKKPSKFLAPKGPSPPKEIMAVSPRTDDTKTAVVEPISRQKVTRENSMDKKQKYNPEKKKQAPVAPQIISTDSTDGDNVDKQELIRIIHTLQSENKRLKDDNYSLKNYIDTLVIKVLEQCPEVLCKDGGM